MFILNFFSNLFKNNYISFKSNILKISNYSILSISHLSTILNGSTTIMLKLISLFRWLSIRMSYFTDNWIYTTNHKRIGINYFNFILVSGTAGMALATVMRVEFAYPGLGLLMGDSAQYLSIASGHGVIMVFFMIMPVLYGAFGNFLLPTQLGVHDVAFPRLNSAAFWFLPGGLIMLCHVVCIDRRYQRMNYFNIREFELMLKRKYINDLINTSDHRDLLDKSMLGLRYKTNSTLNKDLNTHLFYKYGTSTVNKARTFNESDLNVLPNIKFINFIYNTYYNSLLHTTNNLNTNYFSFYCSYILSVLSNLIKNIHLIIATSLHNVLNINFINNFVSANFNSMFNFNSIYSYKSALLLFWDTNSKINNSFVLGNMSLVDTNYESKFNYMEESNPSRFFSFFRPVPVLNYKTGNYTSYWANKYPMNFMTIEELAKIPKTEKFWYFTTYEPYADFIDNFASSYLNLFTKIDPNFIPTFTNVPRFGIPSQRFNFQSKSILPIDTFFNFYYINSQITNNLNLRWVAFANLDQKFYNMFNTTSTQQRIYQKWRELKFTREAWRCKLLVSRNQQTFFKRRLNDENYVVKVIKNAKDLIPGWAMVTPFSARPRYTLIGKTDLGLMGVFLAINASIISSVNFLVTYRYLSTLNNRKMRDARSFFAECLLVGSWMMVAANPMLAIAIIMLLTDRHWKTSFFDFSGGGDSVMFQHMFWFFGHPEVYIIMIPVFGFANTIFSFFLRKRVSARASLMYSLYTIFFLGFWVWGHHMYMVGLSHTTRMLFSTLTVMISVPAATKLMHWCVTLVNSAFVFELPLLFTLCFMFFFVSGGISGMAVAHTGMDILFHDTFYVIGHFHVMLAGAAMLGIFGAFYFYFPALYGVKYSRIYAYIHFVYYLFGQLITILPMLWLGYCGMPRRIFDYPYVLGGWHSISTAGHFLSLAGMVSFFIMIYDSIRQAKPAIRRTFGPARFNTRLNFFLYESYRVSYISRRSFFMQRTRIKPVDSDRLFKNLQVVNREVTFYSYNLVRK